ncbi:MAG: phosphatidate cytidylyltransferase [Actinomycetota bacterium]|nr:phosphatidate cytidylyltransferase [Actinomycetota bacterium]
MTSPPVPATSRAGRNLPVAAAVGVVLAALVLATIYTVKELFVALVVLVLAVAAHEFTTALRSTGAHVPLVPLVAGSTVMLISAYGSGMDALAAAYVLTITAVALARLPGPAVGLGRDVVIGVLVVTYLPLLAGFAMVMLAAPDGPDRIVVFILAVVMSDIGGYAAGVLFGKHKMAPKVSPKKSWEGFVGSVAGGAVATVFSVQLLLDGTWWQGLLIGVVAVLTATVGDLTESLLKRDLGVKDMGRLLPEHGGIMDRLDSLLPTAPVVALLLVAVVGT